MISPAVRCRRQGAALAVVAALALPAHGSDAHDREDVLARLLARAEFGETTLAALEAEVAELGGVAFRAGVPVEYVDSAGLSRYLEELIEEVYPVADAETDALLLRAFDLLSSDVELRSLRRRLMEENVLGFYDTRPGRRRLFAVSGRAQLDASNQMILAHELRHALQDQHLELHSLLSPHVSDFDDRSLALLSLLEGDATFLMEQYLLRRVPEASRRPLRSLAGAPLPPLPGAPGVLRDQMVVPYVRGRDFALAVWQRGGWEALRAAWDAPPVSTEQVLHPERYFAGEAPVVVEPPVGPPGGQLLRRGVLGELLIGSLVGCEGNPCAAAEGWGGDAFGLWHDDEGYARLEWRTEWDSEEDATEFWVAATTRFRERYGAPRGAEDAPCFVADAWRFELRRARSRVEWRSDDRGEQGCGSPDARGPSVDRSAAESR